MPRLEGFSFLRDGYHNAVIQGVEYKNANRSDNPMLVTELALEDGKLVNHYSVVTVTGNQIDWLLEACGFERIKKGKIPPVDLEDFVGIHVLAYAEHGRIARLDRHHSGNLTIK